MADSPFEKLLGAQTAGTSRPDHYALLGAERFSRDIALLKKLVHHHFTRIKAYEDHPDRDLRLKAHELMNAVSSAGADLCDPRRKAKYDRALGGQMVRQGVGHYVLTVTGGQAHLGKRMSVNPAAKPGGVLRWGKDPAEHANLHFDKKGALLRVEPHPDAAVRVNGQSGKLPMIGHGDVLEVAGFRFRCEAVADPKAKSPTHGIRLRLQEARAVRHSWMSLLDGEVGIIGSTDEAFWKLEDGQVRERHCEIRWEQSGWVIRNLDSGASTSVNGAQVAHAPLADRDRLTVGSFAIGVEVADVG
jgi:hypothetical protein